MTDQDLQQWRAMSEKASPGPWCHVQTLTPAGEVHCDIVRAGPQQVILAHDGDGGDADFYEHDAVFIAASREAVPALIAEVERLRSIEQRYAGYDEEFKASGVRTGVLRTSFEAEIQRLSNVYAVAASLRTFPVPFDDHLRLVDAVDAARAVIDMSGADASGVDITFRLRGYLGGSGTAMTPLATVPNSLDLWRILRDAADEIDQLNATIAAERGRR
jgi:hypothetical protein